MTATRSGETILLVEDDELIRRLILPHAQVSGVSGVLGQRRPRGAQSRRGPPRTDRPAESPML